MSRKLQVLLDPKPRRLWEIFTPADLLRLRELVQLHWEQDSEISSEALSEIAAKLDIIIGGNWRYGKLSRFPKLRAFIEVSGRHPSADDFDYASAFARSMRVLSCAPAFGPQVGEMAVAMAQAAAREICIGDSAFKAGREEYLWSGNENTFTLFGRKIGIVGFGNIAQQVQALLLPYGCSFIAYDPWLPASFMERAGVETASLEQVMQESDVIFVLAITSKENKALISRDHLEAMKDGAIFALFSRSHVVDFAALTDVLHSGRIRAAIDVFPQEPLPTDHRIRTAPNTVLSAHRAGSVADDLKLIGRMVLEDVEALSAGIPPRRLQNAEAEIVFRL